jgi:RNA polymerase subunit RPABC4/transcription elongation factor Spt4
LKDGSYSCLIHQQQRALYECERCNSLHCDLCGPSDEESSVICPHCGYDSKTIDWSGLTMTARDAAVEMIPDSVKKAWSYWEKWQERNRPSQGGD